MLAAPRTGTRGGLGDLPGPTPLQEGHTGLLAGQTSSREPHGVSGDVPDPELTGGSLVVGAEPEAPPKSPNSAPELLPTAASPTADPSQEWRVVKIKRVLINPASEPRKASKQNPLLPPSALSPPKKNPAVGWGWGCPAGCGALGSAHAGRWGRILGSEVPASPWSPGTGSFWDDLHGLKTLQESVASPGSRGRQRGGLVLRPQPLSCPWGDAPGGDAPAGSPPPSCRPICKPCFQPSVCFSPEQLLPQLPGQVCPHPAGNWAQGGLFSPSSPRTQGGMAPTSPPSRRGAQNEPDFPNPSPGLPPFGCPKPSQPAPRGRDEGLSMGASSPLLLNAPAAFRGRVSRGGSPGQPSPSSPCSGRSIRSLKGQACLCPGSACS